MCLYYVPTIKMKKLQIIILAIILAFIIVGSISHSYANAETVWRSNNQFAVVSTSKYVVFNISNVTIINFPKNAQDIDIAIYATVGVLNSSHILKVEAVLYEPHSKRAFFCYFPSRFQRHYFKFYHQLWPLKPLERSSLRK
ncbi:exported protein of unknown function [Thermococcus nautili]|nr:exported protein of unknown function [Thermococcus nautili]